MIKVEDFQQRWVNVFTGPEGEERLKDLEFLCGMDQTSYTPKDFEATAFKEGKKDFFLTFKRALTSKPKEKKDGTSR